MQHWMSRWKGSCDAVKVLRISGYSVNRRWQNSKRQYSFEYGNYEHPRKYRTCKYSGETSLKILHNPTTLQIVQQKKRRVFDPHAISYKLKRLSMWPLFQAYLLSTAYRTSSQLRIARWTWRCTCYPIFQCKTMRPYLTSLGSSWVHFPGRIDTKQRELKGLS